MTSMVPMGHILMVAIFQGYHPLRTRRPLGGQSAKLGVFFATQDLGSEEAEKTVGGFSHHKWEN